jgi:hypothetical protein
LRHGWFPALAAVAAHTVHLGDKNTTDEKAQERNAHFNTGHVSDTIEPSGGRSGEDRLGEHKVVSPFRKTPNEEGELNVGHIFAFGSTEERQRGIIFGIQPQGAQHEEKFNHFTGRGYHKGKTGHYDDAIYKKGSTVEAFIHEVFGCMSPGTYRFMKYLARKAYKGKDSTKYAERSRTANSFLTYYMQVISANIVLSDAANINAVIGIRKAMSLQESPQEGL